MWNKCWMWLWIWRINIYSLYFGCFCHFWLILSHFDFTDSRTLSLAYHFGIDTVHRFRYDLISVSNTGCYMAKSPPEFLWPFSGGFCFLKPPCEAMKLISSWVSWCRASSLVSASSQSYLVCVGTKLQPELFRREKNNFQLRKLRHMSNHLRSEWMQWKTSKTLEMKLKSRSMLTKHGNIMFLLCFTI